MSKTFRPWNIEQRWLLPPSVHELVPAGHVAHFVRDTVREELDLAAILSVYSEERGYPPYHPTMMVALRRARGCNPTNSGADDCDPQRPRHGLGSIRTGGEYSVCSRLDLNSGPPDESATSLPTLGPGQGARVSFRQR